MKALTYDQRTLNKVYAELRNQLSSEVSLGLGMAVNEVDEIIYTLKKSFKKKTNATKRIKK